MIIILSVALILLIGCSDSQISSADVYPKYKFMFNIEDDVYHRREEESLTKGHVTGQYSYMDPNGIIRIIKYNSTPETGFHAYGDIGAIVMRNNPTEYQHLQPSSAVHHTQVSKRNNNLKRIFSSNDTSNYKDNIYYDFFIPKNSYLMSRLQQNKQPSTANRSFENSFQNNSVENHFNLPLLLDSSGDQHQSLENQTQPLAQQSVKNKYVIKFHENRSTDPFKFGKMVRQANDYYFYTRNATPIEIPAFDGIYAVKGNDEKYFNSLNYAGKNISPSLPLLGSPLSSPLGQISKKRTTYNKDLNPNAVLSAYKENKGFIKTSGVDKILRDAKDSYVIPEMTKDFHQQVSRNASVSAYKEPVAESFSRVYFRETDNLETEVPKIFLPYAFKKENVNHVRSNTSLDDKHQKEESQIQNERIGLGSFSSNKYPLSSPGNIIPYYIYPTSPLIMLHPGYRFPV